MECIGFDCGPGNVLIDSLMQIFYGREFDQDGTVASKGHINDSLLSWLMKDKFVLRSPPKSTGREVQDETVVQYIPFILSYSYTMLTMCKRLSRNAKMTILVTKIASVLSQVNNNSNFNDILICFYVILQHSQLVQFIITSNNTFKLF